MTKVMDYAEFHAFLLEHDPLEYIPEGSIMVPMSTNYVPEGYVVWMLPEDVVRKAQKGF
jgi:hypothetical protein